MLIKDRITQYPGGPPINNVEVKLYRVSDDALLFTTTTNSNGFFTFDEPGSPGPTYWEATYGAETRRVYGSNSAQVGDIYDGEMKDILRSFQEGVISGFDTLPLGGMVVAVGAGQAIGYNNHLYSSRDIQQFTIAANASGNPRIDSIFLEFNSDSATPPLRDRMLVVQGTPAASPVPPTYAPLASRTIRLHNIYVGNGVGSINAGNITDVRTYTSPAIQDKSVTLAKLAQSGATNGQVPAWNGTNYVPSTPATGGGTLLPGAGGVDVAMWDLANARWHKGRVDHLRIYPFSKVWTNDVAVGSGATVVKDQLTVTPEAGMTFDAIFCATADLRGSGGTSKATFRVAGTGGSNYDVICRSVGGVSNRGTVWGFKENIVGDGSATFTVTFTVIHNATTDPVTIEPGQIFLVLMPRTIPKLVP